MCLFVPKTEAWRSVDGISWLLKNLFQLRDVVLTEVLREITKGILVLNFYEFRYFDVTEGKFWKLKLWLAIQNRHIWIFRIFNLDKSRCYVINKITARSKPLICWRPPWEGFLINCRDKASLRNIIISSWGLFYWLKTKRKPILVCLQYG